MICIQALYLVLLLTSAEENRYPPAGVSNGASQPATGSADAAAAAGAAGAAAVLAAGAAPGAVLPPAAPLLRP